MRVGFVAPALLACAVASAQVEISADGAFDAEPVDLQMPVDVDAALANARIVGMGDQIELIVPLEVPAWARHLGVTERNRVYKGICGPNGAVATPDVLMEQARRDLDREFGAGGGAGGPVLDTVFVGESPRFAITYDLLNPLVVAFYLPTFREAAEYVDGQLDNRVTIGVSLDAVSIPGSVIGSAGSDRFTIPWSTYVEGLRFQSDREGDNYADFLPANSLPVRYNSSGSVTNETEMVVTEAQLRAIFGDNVVPQGEAVSITLDTDNSWRFFDCDISLSGSQISLIDVAVHEITHSLGFVSNIAAGGDNSSDQVQGLDVARFLLDPFSGAVPGIDGGSPIIPAQFTTFRRLGEGFTNAAHLYSNPADGFSTALEEGNTEPGRSSPSQPSHLSFRSSFSDKLGIMDPVLNTGTTFCTSFWSAADIGPLDDMGWRPVAANLVADCNGNGLPDVIDLPIAGDVDNDFIPDTCEFFRNPISTPSEPAGLRAIFYNAPSGTDLSSFNPAANSPFNEQLAGSGPNFGANFGSSGTRVTVLKGAIFAPAKDEYAFRVSHANGDMMLFVGGQLVFDLDDGRSRERANSSTRLAPQQFVQLNAGWHTFEVRLLSTGSTVGTVTDWEARNFGAGGAWRLVDGGDTRALGFVDCDGNSVADAFQSDCDGDGLIDACEQDCDGNGTPDDCENGVAFAVNLGQVGTSDQPITIDTCGSDFDTELGLWDASGTLIEIDDDDALSGCFFQSSSITRTLDPGTYFVAAVGFNTFFEEDFGALASNPTCRDGGSLTFNVGSATDSVTLGSGRTRFYEFTIGEPDCDGDGTPDSQELDCDGNGVPDECENPTIADAIPLGVVGDEASPIVLATCDASFDTELGLWDAAGNLIATDDDGTLAGCNFRTSSITQSLAAGTYYALVSGFNTQYAGNFGYSFPTCGQSNGGSGVFTVGTGSAAYSVGQGRAVFFEFEVSEATPPCNLADVAEPFGTLDIDDVLTFLGAFANSEPLADVAPPMGTLDIDDVLTYLGAFATGCP